MNEHALKSVASRIAWEAFEEWRDDPGSEREGQWALDLFVVLNDQTGVDMVQRIQGERAT